MADEMTLEEYSAGMDNWVRAVQQDLDALFPAGTYKVNSSNVLEFENGLDFLEHTLGCVEHALSLIDPEGRNWTVRIVPGERRFTTR
jgi:hypothetical protein